MKLFASVIFQDTCKFLQSLISHKRYLHQTKFNKVTFEKIEIANNIPNQGANPQESVLNLH